MAADGSTARKTANPNEPSLRIFDRLPDYELLSRL
jgi:hypothetical protein